MKQKLHRPRWQFGCCNLIAHDVVRYFGLAAPHHHEDEEWHVLPRLREQVRSDFADRVLR